MAKITLIGLFNFDPTIFNKINLPEQIDAQTVVDSILFNCGEFEVLYPNPDVFAEAVNFWSKGKLHSWEKIANALYHEYNPFINFTRDERRETDYTPNLLNTRTPNLKTETELDNTNTRTADLTNTRTPNITTETTPTDTTQTDVGAWNEGGLQTKEKITRGGKITNTETGSEVNKETGTDTNRSVGNDTITQSGNETNLQSGNAKTVETFHSEGDSAMYTPTDVAKKEAELRLTFDMIDIIVDSFKQNLVLTLY